ncbi:hypothetical protein N2152v2_005723 [Parachlorella kessleri]
MGNSEIVSEALIALKGAVSANGFGTSKLPSWKVTGNPCYPKAWPGLQCWSGRVTGLLLSNMNIQGTLPVQLRQLNELITLKLDGNKFTGTLPTEWADSRYFSKLQTLDLHDNQLDGTLPSQKWNKKGAFKSLQSLDLSQNNFYGGLPYGWVSTNKVFSQLKFLDLSQNNLGLDANGQQYRVTEVSQFVGHENSNGLTGWCQPGPATLGNDAASTGWCPMGVPLDGAFASLQILDLSDNSFTGLLPTKWPRMFPSLRSLLISQNSLWSLSTDGNNTAGRPAGLPASWTQPTNPIAFKALDFLVLYPGNQNICFLPKADTNTFQAQGFSEVNKDKTYAVSDADGDVYNTDNPWRCASATGPGGSDLDSLPKDVTLTKDPATNKLVVRWSLYKVEVPFAFGFKVTLKSQDISNDDWKVNPKWNGKLFRTYLDADFQQLPWFYSLQANTTADPGKVFYTLQTQIWPDGTGAQMVELVTSGLDNDNSGVASATLPGSV